MLINFILLLNIQLIWFPAGQGLKKGDFSTFLKVDKISNGSEKHFFYNFILNNDVFAVYFRKTFYRFISVMVLT